MNVNQFGVAERRDDFFIVGVVPLDLPHQQLHLLSNRRLNQIISTLDYFR